MIVEPNWNIFRAKFNGKEEWAFEWFSSLLFYKEHNRPTGALRYFNQVGIEADPIAIDNDIIGFQAKFIGSQISTYKSKLIAAIDKAKKENPTLTKIYFYLNQDFPSSSKTGLKDPEYKTDIEQHAKSKGITIVWKTASFFESPFVVDENAKIARHFFTLGEKSIIDFVNELSRHAESILEPVRSGIIFNAKRIKIDRSAITEQLETALAKSPLVIIS